MSANVKLLKWPKIYLCHCAKEYHQAHACVYIDNYVLKNWTKINGVNWIQVNIGISFLTQPGTLDDF